MAGDDLVLDLVIQIGIILLLLAAIVLCIVATVVVVKLAPLLMGTVRNLEKVSIDAAAVSGNTATDIAKTAHNAAGVSEKFTVVSDNLEKISNDVASVSEAIAQDIATTAHNAAGASQNAVEVSGNLRKISADVVSVSGDAMQDIAKTTHNTAALSENAVEAMQNIHGATGDFAETAANVLAISRLDIRAILVQVARGNITNVKDLASFVGNNIPRAASRVGSFFRRGGG